MARERDALPPEGRVGPVRTVIGFLACAVVGHWVGGMIGHQVFTLGWNL